jgi:hypothetical protein
MNENIHAGRQSSSGLHLQQPYRPWARPFERKGLAKRRFNLPQTAKLLTKPVQCAQDTVVISPMQAQDWREALSTAPGSPEPLGPSPTVDGVNFALFSANASAVSLCLFDKDNNPLKELPMQKTGMGSVLP